MFDFEAGSNRKEILNVYKNKAYEYGKTDEEILTFTKTFRASINKPKGAFNKHQFPEYLKQFEKWVLGEPDAA